MILHLHVELSLTDVTYLVAECARLHDLQSAAALPAAAHRAPSASAAAARREPLAAARRAPTAAARRAPTAAARRAPTAAARRALSVAARRAPSAAARRAPTAALAAARRATEELRPRTLDERACGRPTTRPSRPYRYRCRNTRTL